MLGEDAECSFGMQPGNLNESLDAVHDHGGFHGDVGDARGQTALPMKLFHLGYRETENINIKLPFCSNIEPASRLCVHA